MCTWYTPFNGRVRRREGKFYMTPSGRNLLFTFRRFKQMILPLRNFCRKVMSKYKPTTVKVLLAIMFRPALMY